MASPKPTDFQEYWSGETGEFLAVPIPEHNRDLEPNTWFYLDSEWVHETANTPILPPIDLPKAFYTVGKNNQV